MCPLLRFYVIMSQIMTNGKAWGQESLVIGTPFVWFKMNDIVIELQTN